MVDSLQNIWYNTCEPREAGADFRFPVLGLSPIEQVECESDDVEQEFEQREDDFRFLVEVILALFFFFPILRFPYIPLLTK